MTAVPAFGTSRSLVVRAPGDLAPGNIVNLAGLQGAVNPLMSIPSGATLEVTGVEPVADRPAGELRFAVNGIVDGRARQMILLSGNTPEVTVTAVILYPPGAPTSAYAVCTPAELGRTDREIAPLPADYTVIDIRGVPDMPGYLVRRGATLDAYDSAGTLVGEAPSVEEAAAIVAAATSAARVYYDGSQAAYTALAASRRRLAEQRAAQQGPPPELG